ncbi:UNVERIFIED_CONTAM: Secreted RxLR effector protein [Sesamum latifolium]|uniref:Secreted RxLR effector protein n=1 Tax=Sesamum latifolium TaxID=2727402 RepID=A0AAW2YBZ5_9LAMI
MISKSASWVLDTGCGAHICNNLKVLEISRKLSKDEMILRLGDGKAIVAEAVGSLSLVSNLIMTAQHKRKVDNHENAQIWYARLGHISKDRIRRLVDSKSLEIDNLDHLPTCESCLKGKKTKKPFVGQSAIANGLLDLVHTDVCGPLSIPARGRFSYSITFTDDHSRYGYVYLMSTQTAYEIWHGKPASYNYLRVWGSPAYVKRLVGDKLDSRSSLCRFIGYPKEIAGYYFYDLAEQKTFASRNAVFLKKGFPTDSRRDEVLIEESNEEPHTDGVPVLRRSTRESRVPERYGFVGLTSQLENDPKTYGEVMSDIDSDEWPEAMKSKIDSMGSNQIWTLVEPPKGARPVGCKWVYKRAMAKSIRILLAIATWSIYGLKQASRSWNTHFDEVIQGYDFIKNDYDLYIYKKISGSSVAYPVLYVDDILLIGNDIKMLGDIKAWSDVAYALSITSRYQACAGEAHWDVVKSILKYLKRTKDMFLIYGGGELILEGYSDASFQSDDDDAKSQSGFVFKLNGGVVAWKSFKQDTTADSTTEAENIAASEAAKEAVWMKNYIQELGVVPSIAEPVVIFYDNNGAIAQAKESRSHHRSKHTLRRYHLLKEMVSRGDCRMDQVSSAENTTDPLTKPMSQVAHTQHLDNMGSRSMGDWL